MPGDRLSLAVGVRREDHGLPRLHRALQVADRPLAALDHFIAGLETALDLHRELALRQVRLSENVVEDLQPRLHDIFKARAERVAFVKGDDEVDFQYVADVIDLAREAGVDRVGLLTERR